MELGTANARLAIGAETDRRCTPVLRIGTGVVFVNVDSSRSRDLAIPAFAQNSPGLTCYTANGCGESAAASTRAQHRIAHEMFDAMGMDAFAERTRRELQATGDTARKRSSATEVTQLTAQEAQVARMARDGLTNPEIGARLFISPRTVQYHLRKVFTKFGIESRSQLDRVLPD